MRRLLAVAGVVLAMVIGLGVWTLRDDPRPVYRPPAGEIIDCEDVPPAVPSDTPFFECKETFVPATSP